MKKSREELIDIYQDTHHRILNREYNKNLIFYKSKIGESNITQTPIRSYETKITVDNIDCVEKANEFSLKGKTCILNMASYKRPGGGVKRGAMAQEEELCRRSNLMFGLPDRFYPLTIDEYIYTEQVSFFKDKYYNIVDRFKCDVITIAAVNLNGLDRPDNYNDITKDKIKAMLTEPYLNGCKNLVLSAFGCGVFKNDPKYMALQFKLLLDTEFKGVYDNISFAILNDDNSVSDNYNVFKSVL